MWISAFGSLCLSYTHDGPNQAMELTAIRRMFTFFVTSTRSLRLSLAVGGRSSS